MSGPYAYDVLELLAKEAPADCFESLISEARAAGASGEELAALEDARGLGLYIHTQHERRLQRETGLTALVDAARELAGAEGVDGLLAVITRRARLLLGTDMALVSLPEKADGRFRVRACDGHTTRLDGILAPPDGMGLGSSVLNGAAPFWTPDYLADERFPHSGPLDEAVTAEGLRALMGVPLRTGSGSVGILYAADRTIRRFGVDEIAAMSSLADLAGVALERVSLLERATARAAELEECSARSRAGMRALRELSEVQDRMTGQMLEGAGPQALTEQAARDLGRPLRLYGPDATLLGEAGAAHAEAGRAAAAAATMDAYAAGGPTELEDGAWAAPVLAGDEHLGTLLAYPGRPFTGHDRRLLRCVARTMAAGLLVHRSRTAAGDGQQAHEELLDDLLASPKRSAQRLSKRARRLGVDLENPHIVVVAHPEGETHGKEAVWADSYAGRAGGIKSTHDGRTVLLLPGRDSSAAAHAVLEDLAPLLKEEVTVSAAGPVSGAAAVHHGFLEAQRCLSAMTALGLTGRASAAHELGFLGLLLSGNHDVEGFIDSAVGPVIDYDRQRYTDLTHTLEVYFGAGGSARHTAEKLYVHPNTVARRLRRIGELLGPEWQQADRALEIQVALRLARMRHVLRRSEVPHAAEAHQSQGA